MAYFSPKMTTNSSNAHKWNYAQHLCLNFSMYAKKEEACYKNWMVKLKSNAEKVMHWT